MQIKAEVTFRDTLFNCSTQCTYTESNLRYAKGILVGVVGTIIASGVSFEEACEIVIKYLPVDFDRLCVPDWWRKNFFPEMKA